MRLVLSVISGLNGYSLPSPPFPRVMADRSIPWVAAPAPVVAILAAIPAISD